MLLSLILRLLLVQTVLGTGLEAGSSLLMGITNLVQLRLSANATERTSCGQQLLELQNAWQEQRTWALKAFDASGSGYDSFMLGNSYWLGNQFSCRAVNENVMEFFTMQQEQLLRQLAPFEFDYRLAYLQANSHWQLLVSFKDPTMLHIGLCVPQSCDQLQLEQLLRHTLAAADDTNVGFLQHTELMYTKQPKLSGKFFASNGFRCLMLLLCSILVLTLLASVSSLGAISRAVACFDVATNWRQLWQISENTKDIAVISGLRVFSAFSLLILHVVWYKFFSVDHTAELAAKVANLVLHHTYLPLMVEVFFVVSGFLTVSNFLRNEPLQRSIAADTFSGNLRRFLRQLAHRYLRLAPLQFVVLLLAAVSFAYHREASVFHLLEPLDELCSRHWWHNLLFVQNLFPIRTMCANWTWTLGCDMQMQVSAMLLLYLHTRYPNFVRRVVLMLLFGNMIFTVLMLVIQDAQFNLDSMFATGQWFYVSPAVRMLGYLIGCIYGYAHVHGQDAPFNALFSNKLAKSALAGVFLWLVIGLQTGTLIGPAVFGSVTVLLRALIATIAAHMIHCSFHIEQSAAATRWLHNLLQLRCLQRLSRVTYAFYLINPVVILSFYYSFSSAIPSDISILLLLTLAHTIAVLILSYALTLFFELPFNRLTSLLLASDTHKTKSI